MKDTFSKLHHNFSIDLDEEEHEDNKNDPETESRKKEMLKMLMSRDSTNGVQRGKLGGAVMES